MATRSASRTTAARGVHAARQATCGLLALLALATASCTSFGGSAAHGPTGEPGTPGVPPPPALAAIIAPLGARPMDEVARLRGWRTHPGARLRLAYLLQETGDWTTAETELQQLVFGSPAPDPQSEAIARWLRSRGFEKRGDDERATSERSAALLLATDPELRGRLRPAPARPAAASPVTAPDLRSRASWNAASAKQRSMKRMGTISRITIHHSATVCRDDGPPGSIAAIRSIQRYHQQDQGWGDIGYHFLIDPAGRVWTGRGIEWQGAHAGDDARNQGNVGICLLGKFLPGEQGPPGPAQLAALDGLVAALAQRYHVPPKGVMTHRELKDTDCPGPYLQAAVERIRIALAQDRLFARSSR